LTPDICDQGFQLVAPELSDEVSLEGEYSFFMQIPISAASDSALAQELSKTPIELRVTGTIDEPKLSVNGDQPWVSLIKERQSSPQASAGEKALADGLMKALDDFPELT
jgi:hypothetical protein